MEPTQLPRTPGRVENCHYLLRSSGPFLASFLTLTLSDQAYKWFLQEFHDYEFLLQTPAFLKHVGLLLARRGKEPMGAVIGMGCLGS